MIKIMLVSACLIVCLAPLHALAANKSAKSKTPTKLPLQISFLDSMATTVGKRPIIPKYIHVTIKSPDGKLWRHKWSKYAKTRTVFGGFVMKSLTIQPKRWFRGAGNYSIQVKTSKSSWKTKFALTGKELKLHILSGWDKHKSFLVEVQRHWKLSPSIQIKFKHIDKYGSVHVQITNNSKTTLYGTPNFKGDEGFVERKTAKGWVPTHGIYSSDGFFQVDAGKSVIVSEPLLRDPPPRPKGTYRFIKRLGTVHPLYEQPRVVDMQTATVEFTIP